jgi:hypothetical protein
LKFPGSTTLTETPNCAISAANPSVKASTACFDALYMVQPGPDPMPAVELVETIRPLDSMTSGANACVVRKTPSTLTPNS